MHSVSVSLRQQCRKICELRLRIINCLFSAQSLSTSSYSGGGVTRRSGDGVTGDGGRLDERTPIDDDVATVRHLIRSALRWCELAGGPVHPTVIGSQWDWDYRRRCSSSQDESVVLSEHTISRCDGG